MKKIKNKRGKKGGDLGKEKRNGLSALTVLRLRSGCRREGEMTRATRAGRRQTVLDVLVLRAVDMMEVATGSRRG